MMAEPKVRFKRDDGSSYPEWREYSISDLFTKIGDKNKNGQNTNVITNSAEFGLIPQRDYFDKDIAVEGNTGNYTIIQRGDFVYNPRKSSFAPMGPFNCYRLEENGIVSPLYSCLRPKGVLNPEYLLWYFQTDKWYGYVNDHGAQNGARHDRVGMTDKILMGIPVTAPCEEEQQKIADFLSSVDEVISISEQEVANLETQKKAVMKKIFSQEVRFKRDDGSDFPDWEKMLFWDAVSLNSALVDPKEEPFCNMLHVGAANIEKNTGVLLRCSTAAEEGITSGKYLFDEKCVVYSKIRPELSKATIPGFVGLCSADAYPLKPREGILPTIILLQLLSDKFVKFATSTSARTKMPKINQEELGEYMFVIPCLEEQRLIADFLSDFDEAIAAAKKELELWKELKKGLLQQMFV